MNVLEVQGLTKRYPAFTLDHVSFDVPQGAVMGCIEFTREWMPMRHGV